MSLSINIQELDKKINGDWSNILKDIKEWDKEKLKEVWKIHDTIQNMIDVKIQHHNVHISVPQSHQFIWQIMRKYKKMCF